MTDRSSGRVQWQSCTIVDIVELTPKIKSFFLLPSAPFVHAAGQHVDVRLTAPDGYAAVRSYSIASWPSGPNPIELTIERLADGEVSLFFHDIAKAGDRIDLRGPLGGHFVWPSKTRGPVLLIGAGSGLAPLMAMIRQRRVTERSVPVALLLSSRTWRDVPYRDEILATKALLPDFHFAVTLTREAEVREPDFRRHVDTAIVAEIASRLPSPPGHVFSCGSNAFVDVAADGGLAAGLNASRIKTVRYGQ
jgi:ferredoxin-NADP reductase